MTTANRDAVMKRGTKIETIKIEGTGHTSQAVRRATLLTLVSGWVGRFGVGWWFR